jgi:hypothetical protein
MIIIFLLARGTVGASHLHSRKGERPPPRRDTADVRVFVRKQQQASSVRWHSSQSIVGLPTAFAGFVDLIVLVGSLHHIPPPRGNRPRGFSLAFLWLFSGFSLASLWLFSGFSLDQVGQTI